jgi:hypothetical protein
MKLELVFSNIESDDGDSDFDELDDSEEDGEE